MTDYEKLKKCFDEIGIEYYKEIENEIHIYRKDYEKYIEIIFSVNGKYKEMR